MTRLSHLDGAAVNLVAKLAPWLAPLPTAWLIYDRTQQHLRWPWPVALIAGLTLEALGVAILATTLQHYTYNRTKRKSDPAAPLWIGLALVALYLLAAELLTVALDIAPTWIGPLAPAVFPVLSVAAFAILALRADHDQRLTEIEQTKADARAKRQQRKREKANTDQTTTKPEPAPSQPEPFACPLCTKTFRSQPALNGHMNAHRAKEAEPANETQPHIRPIRALHR